MLLLHYFYYCYFYYYYIPATMLLKLHYYYTPISVLLYYDYDATKTILLLYYYVTTTITTTRNQGIVMKRSELTELAHASLERSHDLELFWSSTSSLSHSFTHSSRSRRETWSGTSEKNVNASRVYGLDLTPPPSLVSRLIGNAAQLWWPVKWIVSLHLIQVWEPAPHYLMTLISLNPWFFSLFFFSLAVAFCFLGIVSCFPCLMQWDRRC